MSKHIINAGATSQRFYIYLQDSTTGQGKTGVTGATCYYLRDSVSGSMPAAVTLTFGAVFASPGTYPAWSSGQVREIGYMPGLYLIDIPDAVFAVGARNVVVQIFPTSGTPWLPVNLEFTLASLNIYAAGAIANDVWNAATASYTTAGTFGKLMDTLKKANFVVEGTTVAGSTTTSINTGLTGYLTDAFDNQTILFISGALAGTSSLIISSSSGGAVFTLEQALPAAPASGVDFVVLGTHVHGTQEIANVMWTTDVSGISGVGQAGKLLNDIDTDTTTINSSGYRELVADTVLNRNIAGGGNGTGATTDRTVRSALRALRNRSGISGTTLTVYQEDDAATAWTATVSTSAGANPVTGIDPAGP